jgi:hypothetical protein
MTDKLLPFKIKEIISDPVKTWNSIDSEIKSAGETGNRLIIPLLLLVSLAAIAGSLLFTNSQLSAIYSVFIGIKCFLVFFITIYATAFILKAIASQFELRISYDISIMLIAYSVVPLLLCQFLSRFFESLLFVNILALYGLYIFWAGMENLLKPPSNRKVALLIAAAVIFTVIYIAANFIFTIIIDRGYFIFFS